MGVKMTENSVSERPGGLPGAFRGLLGASGKLPARKVSFFDEFFFRKSLSFEGSDRGFKRVRSIENQFECRLIRIDLEQKLHTKDGLFHNAYILQEYLRSP